MLAPVKNLKPTVPLSAALLTVSEILRAVEEDDPDSLEELYQDERFVESAKADFKSAIDRRIIADRAFKAATRMAEEAAKEWEARVKTIKKAYSSFKENTMWHMAMHPEVKFVGTEGRLTIQRNGGRPSLKLNFETDELKYVVTDEDIFKFDLPPDCWDEVSVKVLNKEKLTEHIKKNSELDLEDLNTPVTTYLAKHSAGTLTRGSHLKVRLR